MSDSKPPVDDELVSAVLDGEATAEERALVEGTPEGRARLEQMRRVAERVAEPVVALDAATVDALVDGVLPPTADTPLPGPGPDPVADRAPQDELTARRRRRAGFGRALAATAAVAAVALLLVGLVGVAGRSGSSDESASSGAASDQSQMAAEAGDATSAADAGLGADRSDLLGLGLAESADELVGRLSTLVAPAPGGEPLFESDGASRAPTVPATDDRTPVCTTPEPPVAASASWVAVATGTLQDRAVVLLVDGPVVTGADVLVVDAVSCEVLARGEI